MLLSHFTLLLSHDALEMFVHCLKKQYDLALKLHRKIVSLTFLTFSSSNGESF